MGTTSFHENLIEIRHLRVEEISYQVIYASLPVDSTKTVNIFKCMYTYLPEEWLQQHSINVLNRDFS